MSCPSMEDTSERANTRSLFAVKGETWQRSSHILLNLHQLVIFRVLKETHMLLLDQARVVLGRMEMRIGRSTSKEIGRAHSELQSLMRISSAVFCLNKKK